jgi:SAM-dependent methyltransferase
MKKLRWPGVDHLDLDDPSTTVLRKSILRRKPFLYKTYLHFYSELLGAVNGLPKGVVVEVGSGPGFLKELMPSVVTSELFPVPGIDVAFSADCLPFRENTVSCILMVDVFHHLKKPADFLKEAERCLVQGGKVVMVEPYNTPFGRFIYRNFHHEPFDPESGWDQIGGGPLSGANVALPWIVFARDAPRYRMEFPNLQLKGIQLHTPFSYLLSGGFAFRSLIPGILFGTVKFLENSLSPFMSKIAMFSTIELRKTG